MDKERCKGCDLCANFCRQRAIRLLGEINSRGFHPASLVEIEKCTGCAHCALVCPEACITVYDERRRTAPRDDPPSEDRSR